MAQIIKFPGLASKFGYTRVKRRRKSAENPDQLQLFALATAKILDLGLAASSFEQALMLDEREDSKATEMYVRAIDENDCVADAYCNLGILQSKHGETAQAFDSFTKSLAQNPRHFEAHYNLGNLYSNVEDHRLAQVHYQIAAEIDPLFANVFFNLALVQAINNDLSGAVTSLTTYQNLVSMEEGQDSNDLLESLKKSLAASKSAQSGSAR